MKSILEFKTLTIWYLQIAPFCDLEVKETYKSHNENETFEFMLNIKKVKVTVCPPAGLANSYLTVRKDGRYFRLLG